MSAKSRTKARVAAVLILVSACCLGFVLVTCLPPRLDRPGGPAGAGPAGSPPLPGTLPVPAARPARPESTGRLAIIIDDAGYSLEDLQPFLEFQGEIAIAVLPHLLRSAEAARRVKAAGKELLLHMPMEPLDEREDPGPGAILTGQSDTEIENRLASAFASVPGADGMNNHMGSRASADQRVMDVVARYLKREGKYFVDSRTTADSIGARSAARAGVPYLERSVFIDNERDTPDLEKSIAQGVAEARSTGHAVLIGHVHSPQLLAIVRKRVSADPEVRLAGLAELLGGGREGQE